MKVVAMKGRRCVLLCVVSFVSCECHQRPERAFGLTFWRLPVQAVLLPSVANELQSELLRASGVVRPGKVLKLGVSHRLTNFDHCQFIPTDAPRQNLILSRSRIEEPLAGGVLLQRDREGKIVNGSSI